MNENNSIVSIIIPTYNRAHLIKRSINSILNQTYTNFELIVVDDGSTDNTKEIVNDYNDQRIKYIAHETNIGASAAMNTGIKNSSSDFIAFQGSDDEWYPEKLEKEIKVFNDSSSKVGVVYSGIWSIENNKKIFKPNPNISKKEGKIYSELLKGNFINGLCTIRKVCFTECGLFDENLLGLEDWELFIRIAKKYEFRYVNEPLIIAHNAEGNISSDFLKIFKARKLILEKHFYEFSKDKKILARNYAILGSILYLSGEKKFSRKYFIKAIKSDYKNPNYTLIYLLSFFGENLYNKILNYTR